MPADGGELLGQRVRVIWVEYGSRRGWIHEQERLELVQREVRQEASIADVSGEGALATRGKFTR